MLGQINYFGVLAISVLIYWSLPKKLRFGSIFFISFCYLYMLDGPIFSGENGLIVSAFITKNRMTLYELLLWTVLFYFIPANLDRFSRVRPYVIPALILSMLGYLSYHKYLPSLIGYITGKPLTSGIIIPLGISYFSFKFIHYAIEVSRGNIATHSFSNFLGYIFLFPIFTAGPIERFDHFQKERESSICRDSIVAGITRIIHGLIKKFFIAGVLLTSIQAGLTTDLLLNNLHSLQTYQVWRYLVISYLIIYMDFSAYSDIAIGSSRLMGFKIMENFNWPIFASNISMFWKRWHMTLANWCQAYIYMPTLGLTRQPYLSVFMTFLVIGLWHAGSLNFVAWGLYHAVGVSLYLTWARYKRTKKITLFDKGPLKYLGIPITFLFMSGSFAFTLTYSHHSSGGLYSALRILAKCFFIDLPQGVS